MENTDNKKEENENFNFDKYIEENEGAISKFTKWFCEKLNTFLKFKIVGIKLQSIVTFITIIGVVISGVALWKQFNTKDSGEIIEMIYQEAKTNIAEIQRQIAIVQLPDSLENSKEVLQIRSLQNDILKFHIMYSNIATGIKLFEKEISTAEEQDTLRKNLKEYIKRSVYIFKDLLVLNDIKSKTINNNLLSFAINNAIDTIAIHSISLNSLESSLNQQEIFKNKLIKFVNTMNTRKDAEWNFNLIRNFIKSEDLQNNYEAIKQTNLVFLNATNVRLLNIKNEAIKRAMQDNPKPKQIILDS